MSNSIKDYRKMVEEPWGRMFYDLIYRQLNIEDDKRKKILDFGAGFCITSSHYAERHDVTAVEPNEEMYSMRFPGDYNLITEGIDYLKNIDDNSFDFVFCHNVLRAKSSRSTLSRVTTFLWVLSDASSSGSVGTDLTVPLLHPVHSLQVSSLQRQ